MLEYQIKSENTNLTNQCSSVWVTVLFEWVQLNKQAPATSKDNVTLVNQASLYKILMYMNKEKILEPFINEKFQWSVSVF